MQVIYLKKRTLISILIILTAIIFLWIYSTNFKTETLGVLLNNENDMPIYSVDVPDRRVALTFDVAWGDEYLTDILDVLDRYDVRATFFVTGMWAEKHPELLQSIARKNYEIGNHSLTHVKMPGMSSKAIISEIQNAESAIVRITGKKTKLFRAPFGEYDSNVVSAAKKLGYNIIQWDLNSLDWKEESSDAIFTRVVSKVSNGSIILFHNSNSTSEAVLKVIEKLRSDGYKFVTVTELMLKENYYIDNTGRQRSLK